MKIKEISPLIANHTSVYSKIFQEPQKEQRITRAALGSTRSDLTLGDWSRVVWYQMQRHSIDLAQAPGFFKRPVVFVPEAPHPSPIGAYWRRGNQYGQTGDYMARLLGCEAQMPHPRNPTYVNSPEQKSRCLARTPYILLCDDHMSVPRRAGGIRDKRAQRDRHFIFSLCKIRRPLW